MCGHRGIGGTVLLAVVVDGTAALPARCGAAAASAAAL